MPRTGRLLLLLLLLGALAACNRGQAQPADADLSSIREPKPTFTPTAGAAPAAQPGAGTGESAAVGDGQTQAGSSEPANAPALAQPTGAKAVISDPLVNVRSGPGLDFDVVVVAERGEEFDITGKSGDGEWWQICCTADGTTAWVINRLVQTDGPVDAVPVVGANQVAALDEFTVGRVTASVNIPLLNARAEPNTDSEVVEIVEAGQRFDVLAANDARDWYQICCIEGQEAWLTAEFIDLQGPAGIVPVFGQGAPPASAAPAFTFELTNQEQFAETDGVRLYLFVTDAEDNAVAGYGASVTKDGQPLAADGTSFGGQPGFTWPFQDARQRSQNWKAEFPDTPAGGVWEVQLTDGSGQPVGPAAAFELAENDPNQELYVRYEQQ